ncbi:hypothetical protein SteCoe_25456 [Stentor coeruleus]|uniref:Histone-lysine N-methyltransferase, H3 lysine-79 specific n=1 Tax=Stentor coeruleus TaxID=5963 RepID=A0A1R2BFB5_9CILI|nr:hypothetical protein SteCoe_25456 [Stentor coeruleus]
MEGIDSQIATWLTRRYPVEEPYILPQDQRDSLVRKNEVFQRLVSEFPVSIGKEASRKEREEKTFENNSDSTLTYGEVDFISIGEVFYTIEHRFKCLPKDGVFYDLGSGTGKGVIAGALLGTFTISKGIELLERLYAISEQIKVVYDQNFPAMQSENQDLWPVSSNIEFINSDFFKVDWSDASFIFANSTCFDHNMMQRIGQVKLRHGTIGISFTKTIPGNNWIVLESIKKNMSWGEATVYIQRYVDAVEIERVAEQLKEKPVVEEEVLE